MNGILGKRLKYIVINIGGPTRVDLHTCIAIRSNCRDKRPHLVDLVYIISCVSWMEFRIPYLIHQDRARIVTDDIHDSRGDPSPNSVTIVKTCNCWRDKSLRTKFCRSSNTDLRKPSLIPCDLVVYIEVCRVILIFVCKCVGDVGKCIEV
jgi:hypothetical protein